MLKFEHSFAVRNEDIDEQGHVNNVAYLRWVQNVAVAHWRQAATEEQQAKFTWVVLRHEIDYKKQAFAGEEITVSTWVGEWTTVTCERFTEIYRGSDLLVKSRTVWCMLNSTAKKPTRILSELKELFKARGV